MNGFPHDIAFMILVLMIFLTYVIVVEILMLDDQAFSFSLKRFQPVAQPQIFWFDSKGAISEKPLFHPSSFIISSIRSLIELRSSRLPVYRKRRYLTLESPMPNRVWFAVNLFMQLNRSLKACLSFDQIVKLLIRIALELMRVTTHIFYSVYGHKLE